MLTFILGISLQVNALVGSGLVVDDTVTWTKGEILGRGAYGTVSTVSIQLNLSSNFKPDEFTQYSLSTDIY